MDTQAFCLYIRYMIFFRYNYYSITPLIYYMPKARGHCHAVVFHTTILLSQLTQDDTNMEFSWQN